MKTLAVIPARAGSKRIPHKNMVDLGGKPLIQWTIEAAKQATCIDDIVICTNDHDVMQLATAMRVGSWQPKDHDFECGAVDATIKTVRDWGAYKPGLVMMLLPTSPFRTAAHIQDAEKKYIESVYPNLISVVMADIDMRTIRYIDGDDDLYSFYQDERLCHSNGAIQITEADWLLRHHSFQAGPCVPYIMDPDKGIDIDTPKDLERAREICRSFSLQSA